MSGRAQRGDRPSQEQGPRTDQEKPWGRPPPGPRLPRVQRPEDPTVAGKRASGPAPPPRAGGALPAQRQPMRALQEPRGEQRGVASAPRLEAAGPFPDRRLSPPALGWRWRSARGVPHVRASRARAWCPTCRKSHLVPFPVAPGICARHARRRARCCGRSGCSRRCWRRFLTGMWCSPCRVRCGASSSGGGSCRLTSHGAARRRSASTRRRDWARTCARDRGVGRHRRGRGPMAAASRGALRPSGRRGPGALRHGRRVAGQGQPGKRLTLVGTQAWSARDGFPNRKSRSYNPPGGVEGPGWSLEPLRVAGPRAPAGRVRSRQRARAGGVADQSAYRFPGASRSSWIVRAALLGRQPGALVCIATAADPGPAIGHHDLHHARRDEPGCSAPKGENDFLCPVVQLVRNASVIEDLVVVGDRGPGPPV